MNTMNTIKSIAAVIATVAATASFAQEASPDTWVAQAKSFASRQAVEKEARTARIAGLTQGGEAQGHDFSKQYTPVLTRAQVVAEATEARKLGLTQGGEVVRIATPAEAERIARAGQMALSSNVASR
jgi:hypothetical protein